MQQTRGRPVDAGKNEAFEKMCEWLETTDCDLLTLSDLIEKAKCLSGLQETYCEDWIKSKLLQRYGTRIFFAEVNGRRNVVCWRNMASFIINEKWYADRCKNVEDDARRIVIAAAKLIRSQIREVQTYSTDYYPTGNSIKDVNKLTEWMPSLLQEFTAKLVNNPVKAVAIGHCIINCVRPNTTISPLLFGVGVSLSRAFASKWMLNVLNRLGFSISYDEVGRYRQCVVRSG